MTQGMTSRTRTSFLVLCTAIATLAGSLLLAQFRDMGRAEAQPIGAPDVLVTAPNLDAGVDALPPSDAAVMSEAPAAPAPTDVAKQAVESQWRLVENYGPIWGGMLLLFGLGTVVAKRSGKGDEHWLLKGHTLTGGIGALGLLGALLEANFTSAPGAGIPVTLFMAMNLLLQKPTLAKAPAPPAPPQP